MRRLRDELSKPLRQRRSVTGPASCDRKPPTTPSSASWPAGTHATAAEIGTACAMASAEVRARLVMLESMRLVAGQQDARLVPPARVFAITAEGRRRVDDGDGRPA